MTYVLGLIRVKDGADRLKECLDSLLGCCDAVYAVDDRSTDTTAEILMRHPLVANLVQARAELGSTPWLVSEAAGLGLLYRMADFCQPDWVVMVDHDQTLADPIRTREILEGAPPEAPGIIGTLRSVWSDPDHPRMVPLMGDATSRRCLFWRYTEGLVPGAAFLHNGYSPPTLDLASCVQSEHCVLEHHGWRTLKHRIAQAALYQSLDPGAKLNHGVAYDRGLLFGYALGEVPELLAEYRRRLTLPSAP